MRESSDIDVRVLSRETSEIDVWVFFWERHLLCTKARDNFLIYKYVKSFTTVDNMIYDEMIALYTIVDYKKLVIYPFCNYKWKIVGTRIWTNEKLLVLGFEPFHFMYISLQLLIMSEMSFNKYKNI